MENRSGLVVATRLTQATGLAEREAAGTLIESVPGRHRITVGADRAYAARVGRAFTLAAAAYNLIRLPKLLAAVP